MFLSKCMHNLKLPYWSKSCNENHFKSMSTVCKIRHRSNRSETLSLHNHDSVKDLPNFSHVEKVSQKDPEFTNQLLYD